MLAGYADVDITPPPGEEMTGYGYYLNRRATGSLDPLMGRAVALEEGGQRAVVVQLDLLGLPGDLVAQVREGAHERLGLSPERLLLHCTHTHSGPATAQVEGCGRASEYYPRQLRAHLLDVVERALGDLRPVSEAGRFDVDFADGFAHNRVGGDDLDTQVRGVEMRFGDAQPLVVVSYACHPVTLGPNREYSADYPGYAIRELNAYGLRTLYLNGCCGDINPLSNGFRWGSGTAETLRIYGRDLAASVREGLHSTRWWETGPIEARSRLVPLDYVTPDPEQLRQDLEALADRLRHDPDDGPARVDAAWHRQMIELSERGGLDQAMTAEIQAIACGDVVFAGLSAEAFTRMGQIVREGAPDHLLLVGATANAVRGYIGTPEDVEQNGYASVAAAKIYGMAPLTPEAGLRWAREGARVVREAVGLD
jgi:hypothetical protein